MVTNMVIFLTVLVYGVNFLVYMYLKINHIKDYVEKIAIYFGTNMTLLFTSSIFCFWKNSKKTAFWYSNKQNFCRKRLTCHTL